MIRIEEILTNFPTYQEITVKQDALVYTFNSKKYPLLSKLRSYLYLLEHQGLFQTSYISDIHRLDDESHSFTMVLKQDRPGGSN